jgi:hypothetical protein
MRWLFVLIMGAGLGVVAAFSNAANADDPSQFSRALHLVFNLGTVWGAAAVIGGWLMAKAPWSVLGGPLVLIFAVLGYYVYGRVTGDLDVGFNDLSSRAQLLMIALVLMGPLLGLLGGVARTGDIPGTLARVAVPVALATEIQVRFPLHSAEYSSDPLLAWTTTCLLIAGVLGATIAMISGQHSSQ